ncbi:hypothetical protein D3C85_1925320 [compost metagenome]
MVARALALLALMKKPLTPINGWAGLSPAVGRASTANLMPFFWTSGTFQGPVRK